MSCSVYACPSRSISGSGLRAVTGRCDRTKLAVEREFVMGMPDLHWLARRHLRCMTGAEDAAQAFALNAGNHAR